MKGLSFFNKRYRKMQALLQYKLRKDDNVEETK